MHLAGKLSWAFYDLSIFLTRLLSRTTCFRVRPNFGFVGHCLPCSVQRGVRADYPLPNCCRTVRWISDISEILVSWFRLSLSWSKATKPLAHQSQALFSSLRLREVANRVSEGWHRLPRQHISALLLAWLKNVFYSSTFSSLVLLLQCFLLLPAWLSNKTLLSIVSSQNGPQEQVDVQCEHENCELSLYNADYLLGQ